MKFIMLNSIENTSDIRVWPGQKTIEVATGTIYVGTMHTGLPIAMYDARNFVWRELTIEGDLTGRTFTSFIVEVL